MRGRTICLRGASVATGPDTSERTDLMICEGRISVDGIPDRDIDLTGHLLLPGLINAHDHLEFSLFPTLGEGLYRNATEWASSIYRPDASPVKEQRALPKTARLFWGGLRNLLSGMTTVAHHNPYDHATFGDLFPVRVLEECGWAHSLEFSPDLVQRFEATPEGWPFIVHAAEGADANARAEVRKLDAMGVLSDRTVIIHANAAGPDDIDLLRHRGCSLVWCPTSNLSTYGQTLSCETLMSGIPIALGTDSAITAPIDMLDEIRVAKKLSGLSARKIYAMVTSQPAKVLHLKRGEGTITEGGVADLIAVKDCGQTPADAIFNLHPELVMLAGEIKLLSKRFASTHPHDCFHRITLEHRGEWFVDADIPRLIRESAAATGSDLRLAGKLVSS